MNLVQKGVSMKKSVLISTCLYLAAQTALAQSVWPNKPVKIVIGFPTGGAPDILARVLAEKWSALGQAVTVENKPGAGGNIGADFVAKSAPDGYTLLVGTVGSQTINPSLYRKMPYNAATDFTSISFLGSTPNLLVLNNNVPAKSVKELIDLAKAKPDTLSYGSPGNGTSNHMSGEMFNIQAGVQTRHVPYRGRAQAIPDLLGGHITMMFDNMPSSFPLVKSGELRGLAVTSAKRSPAAPNIPTMAEAGLPAYEATSWFAVFGPAKMPKDVLAKVNQEVIRAVNLPDVKEKLFQLGLDMQPGTPEALDALIQTETVKWAKVVKESGAKID
jgi:tripartite-type tricarboxylate transporter receptor subunit TctC